MSFTSRWVDVYVASVAQFLGNMGAFLVMTTLVLTLQDGGAGGLQVAGLTVAEVLPMVLLGRLAGRLADRFDSRALLVIAGVGQIAACVALSTAHSYEFMLLGGVALAVATGVAQPVRAALLPEMVVRDDLARASAIGQTAGSVGGMLGPAVAGLLVGAVDAQRTLQIAAFGFLGTVAAGLLLRTRRGGARAAVRAGSARTAPGAAAGAGPAWQLADDPLLRITVWGLTIVVGAVSAVNVVEVFFVVQTLHSSASLYGVISSMWMVGMLGGAWLLARFIHPATADAALVRWLFLGLGAVSLVVLASAAAPAALWIVPCWLLGGAANGGQNVMVGTLLGRRVPASARGRASAALQARVQGGALLGFLAGGLLLEWAQPRWIIAVAGVLGLVAVVLVTPVVRRVSRAAPPAEAASAASPPSRAALV